MPVFWTRQVLRGVVFRGDRGILKYWLSFFLLILGLVGTTAPALACSCAPPEAAEAALERATAVFSGRVIAVKAPGVQQP